MSGTYELWLTDDTGNRLAYLADFGEPNFFSYTRAVSQISVFSVGLDYRAFSQKFNPYFKPDWRVELWRSAAYGVPLRLEDVFMLRKPNVYMRQDNVEILQFYGRNGIDLLNRRFVVQKDGTSYTRKSDYADDMMKDVVREQSLYGSVVDETGTADNSRGFPQGEWSVSPDNSLGPSISQNFAGKKVYDVLDGIKKETFQLNEDSPSTYERVYFDVRPIVLSPTAAPSGSRLGWIFNTSVGLLGMDRTLNGKIFSAENENLSDPSYSINHLDEVTAVFALGNGAGNSRIVQEVTAANRLQASRWNRIESVVNSSSSTSTAQLNAAGRAELRANRPVEEFQGTILNTPGRNDVPQSLYGIDWDLGDLLRVEYARKQFDAEVVNVYVSVNDKGEEEITGRMEVRNT